MPTRCLHAWSLLLLATFALLATGQDVRAANLQVAPTSITLQARQSAGGLTLSNTGSEPLHAQLRVFRWTQNAGEDELEATSDIALSPPMIELAPGARQLVRIVRTGPPPAGHEASYRVIVDELPTAERGDGGEPAQPSPPGLQFVLRYSIPVFLMPAGARELAPALRTRLVDGNRIEISNTGDGHAQVADLVFVGRDGQRIAIAPGLSGYVLPGQRKRWELPALFTTPPDGAFKARINGEPVERTLALDATTR
ncbi:fimbrial biogenesis chaperone [Marilutibacter alkalisoli]|uniref:Molecular chaperone n=1 Tax=Marilutibacter alkalisoli TaxID=2591633 RepID=A0A514BWR0_9GAMM|nr:molecular chaperone [Lysobacter alkalisoli]QDH71844.1 molecular chaperone [Lysobacter alkalisoli]